MKHRMPQICKISSLFSWEPYLEMQKGREVLLPHLRRFPLQWRDRPSVSRGDEKRHTGGTLISHNSKSNTHHAKATGCARKDVFFLSHAKFRTDTPLHFLFIQRAERKSLLLCLISSFLLLPASHNKLKKKK